MTVLVTLSLCYARFRYRDVLKVRVVLVPLLLSQVTSALDLLIVGDLFFSDRVFPPPVLRRGSSLSASLALSMWAAPPIFDSSPSFSCGSFLRSPRLMPLKEVKISLDLCATPQT